MYSVLLLMALSGSGEAPAFGHHHGCCGGYDCGCCGGYYDCGCCGGGWGCHGCHGGHSWHHSCCGCHGWHHHHHCHGCCGCWGYDCGGCCGGYGCWGGYGCCGGYGCNGYGGGCYGYYGGCCGGGDWGYGGGSMMPGAAPAAAPAGPAGPGAPGAPGAPPADLPKDKKTSMAAPASIVVRLPADAALRIDDQLTASKSELRRFTSPELAPEKEYHYTLQAEIVRDGQKLTVTERVTVRAGEETQVMLPLAKFAGTSVASR
jgi:uncharacterized protein (TIGR03000 family)